jgi:release factor glutamine methyltransferase
MQRLFQRAACRVIQGIQRYGPKTVRVADCTFVVTSDVFNPKFFVTSGLMARQLALRPEDDVLDLGTGSGIQAIVAAKQAARVVAIDINPEAVACAQANCERNGVDNVTVLQGDLFEPLSTGDRFDVIIFTPPYMEGPLTSLLSRALYDPGKALARRFFAKARNHLAPGGSLLVLYSSIADHEQVLEIAGVHGWQHEQLVVHKTWLETYFIYRMVPRRAGFAQ